MLPSFEDTQTAFKYRSDKELKLARFLFSSMASPFITKIGLKLTKWALAVHLPIKGLIKSTIFKQLCGGETMQEAAKTADMLAQYGISVILDYGVEGNVSEEAFNHAVEEFIKAIDYASEEKNIPFVSLKITGFGRFDLLEKINSGEQLDAEEQQEWERVTNRVDHVCRRAAEKNVMVLIDAEESWIQIPVDAIADKMMSVYNKGKVVVFNTFQMYRHDRFKFLRESYFKAKEQGYFLGAKIVRGAYMEKERQRAEEMNYPSPIQIEKIDTDLDYDIAVLFGLKHIEDMALFIGTHNEKSCLKAIEAMGIFKIKAEHPHIYFSQLYGMSDNISFNLASHHYQVSKYLPYGPVEDVMPYLMRRAQENTSVAGQTSRELALIKTELKRRKLA